MTRDQTLNFYTDDAKVIRQTAGQCLKRVPLQQRLRLLGVRVASLAAADDSPLYMKNRPVAPAGIALEAIDSEATERQLF